jgi:glycosyltransferase involved in cell wall biosynthesis
VVTFLTGDIPERRAGDGRPLASVVVPAHDEESVIGRCLATLLDGAPAGVLEVVVVANGCRDRTAAVASGFGPDVRVVEDPEPGKTRALNTGDGAVSTFPRVYLDADLELTYPALVEVVERMRATGALAGSPAPRIETAGLSLLVRAYYSIWQEMPYGRGALAGGVYVLSEAGRRRFGRFPTVIADDLFVRRLFQPAETVRVESATYLVRPPRTLRDLVRVQARARVGNAELRGTAPAAGDGSGDGGRAAAVLQRFRLLALRPRLWPAVPVHAVVYALVRGYGVVLRRRRARTWSRDESSRTRGCVGGAA